MTHKRSRSAVLMRAPFSGDRHTTLANTMLRDKNLSFKARGILSYLGTHKLGWQTSEEQLTQESPDRITSIRSGMAELEEDRYLRRFREREPDGTMGQALWIFSDEPSLLEEFVTAVLADLAQQGRVFVPLTQRTRSSVRRKRKPAPAAPAGEEQAPANTDTGPPPAPPTLENPHQEGSDGFSRSEPTGDFPSLDEPRLEKPPLKKPKGKGEGEEGTARAREEPDPTLATTGPWGVTGQRKPEGVNQESGRLIADLARGILTRDEHLTQAGHMDLAALLTRARAIVDQTPWLSWEEYMGWLWQGWFHASGRKSYRDFEGALRWRLQQEQITGVAVAWACEQRGEKEVAVEGERTPPSEDDPFAGELGPGQSCLIHGMVLTSDGRCLECQNLGEPPPVEDPWLAPRPVADPDARPSLPGANRARDAFRQALENPPGKRSDGD